MRSNLIRALLICALALPVTLRAEPDECSFHPATVSCPFVPGADRDQGIHHLKPLVAADGRAIISGTGTLTRFCYDEERIYMNLLWRKSAEKLAPGSGSADERRATGVQHLRIFLQPDASSDTTYELHASVDRQLKGRRWRRGQSPDQWDSGTTVRELPSVGASDFYQVQIPFEALGGCPEPGETWGFNLVRSDTGTGEHPNWAGVAEEDALPFKLGVLRFLGKDDVFVGNWIYRELRPVKGNTLSFGIQLRKNVPELESRIILSDASGEGPFVWSEARFASTSGDFSWYQHVFAIPRGAPLLVQSVITRGDTIYYATAPIRVAIPDVRDSAARLKRACAELAVEADDVANASARETCVSLAEELHGMAKALADEIAVSLNNAPSKERFKLVDEAADRIEKLEKARRMLAGRAAALRALPAQAPLPRFGVGHTHGLLKLRRFQGDVDYGTPVRMELARRERESAQLVVLPFDEPLKGVDASWTDLKGPDGTKLSAANVRIDLVGYVKTAPGGYPSPWVGWWPDPLLPLEPVDVAPGRIQPLWVTVYAPAGTPAGIYHGDVTVTTSNAGAVRVPLEVEVWDYDLPLRGTFKTAITISFGPMTAHKALTRWYGFDMIGPRGDSPQTLPRDFRLKMYDLMLEHRISPCTLYQRHAMPDKEDFGYCVDRGMNTFPIILTELTEERIAYLKDWHEFLKRNGWLDMFYLWGYDEVEFNPQRIPDMINGFTTVKKLFPDVPTFSTVTHPHPEWDHLIDIWVPHVPEYDHAEWVEHCRKTGDKVWWYTTCEYPPFAGMLLDVPAVKHRVLFWQHYQYGIEGYLYYSTMGWTGNQIAPGKPRWPEVPWVPNGYHNNHNGCGQLLYPGKDRLLASIRLEVIRDGIEDYEAFAVLEQLTNELEASGKDEKLVQANRRMLAVPSEVTEDLRTYTEDALVLLEHRRLLAEQIVRTKRAIEESAP